MTLDDILQDIHVLEQDLQTYERKYGVLSETFYESYVNGEEPDDDAWVMDWSAWAGTYEIWLRRREQYQAAIQALKAQTPILVNIIKRTARRESIPVPPQPHPHDPSLASTDPHHKHIPPDIKHNRVPAPELRFDAPNLPFLIEEIERKLPK